MNSQIVRDRRDVQYFLICSLGHSAREIPLCFYFLSSFRCFLKPHCIMGYFYFKSHVFIFKNKIKKCKVFSSFTNPIFLLQQYILRSFIKRRKIFHFLLLFRTTQLLLDPNIVLTFDHVQIRVQFIISLFKKENI